MAKTKCFYYRLYEQLIVVYNNGGILSQFAKKLMTSYKHISYVINSDNVNKRLAGENDKKYSKLCQFKDIHKGKRCFVICTGPSLTVEDVDKLRDEYTFGMNSIVKLFDKTEWRPTYYIISDALAYDTLRGNQFFKSLKNKFVSSDIAKAEKIDGSDIAYYVDGYDCFKHGHATKFSNNAYVKVFSGYTVTYEALQLAAYMGFKEIYLLGCDSDYSGQKKHFDEYFDKDSKLNSVDFKTNHLLESYKTAQAYCRTHDLKIYNATRGGKLEVFPRVDFDSLWHENK